MVSAGYAPKCHFVWSDGCASQFKSSKPWYFVSQYPAMTNGCEMMWSFFGSAHGKGPHDGAGAVVKRFIRKEQLNAHGAKLTCAADVVQFLKENLAERPESSYTGARKPMKRMFWHIGANDVKHKDEAHDCDVVQGTRKIHSIRAANKKCNPTSREKTCLLLLFLHAERLGLLPELRMDRAMVSRTSATETDEASEGCYDSELAYW